MSRRTRILLYVLFGCVTFAISLLLTFPYDVLGRLMETELAKDVPGAAVTINKIGPSLPLGLYMGDVVYETPPTKDAENGTPIQIDAIRIKPAWLKLLTMKPGIAFNIRGFAGEISGQTWRAGQNTGLDIKAKDIHIEDGGFLEKALGVQLQGALTGRLNGVIGPSAFKGGPPTLNEGTFEATLDSARIKGGKVMGFSVPATDLGSPEISATITKGEAKIETIKAKSSDIDINGTGSLSIRQNMMQAPVHGNIKIKLSDEWFARNPTIKGMLSFAGPFKKPDGTLEVPLTGTLARPINIPGFR
jgi:type II secretion system protein N